MSNTIEDLTEEQVENLLHGIENEAGFVILAMAELVSIFAFWFGIWPTYFGLQRTLGYGLAVFFGLSGVLGYYLAFTYLSRT